MSISPHLAKLNDRLTFLEQCAQKAPEGTYQRAKDAVEAVADASQGIMDALRSYGFAPLNDDRLRNLEAAIYGYLLEGNPNEYGLITGEGFGEHVYGPAGERILAQTVRERDALKRIMGRSA